MPENIPVGFREVTIDTVNSLIVEHRQGGDYFYDFKSLKRISSFYKDGFFYNSSDSVLFGELTFFDKNRFFYLKNGTWRISKSDRDIINSIKPIKKIIYEQENTLKIIYDKNEVRMSNPGEFIGEIKNYLTLSISNQAINNICKYQFKSDQFFPIGLNPNEWSREVYNDIHDFSSNGEWFIFGNSLFNTKECLEVNWFNELLKNKKEDANYYFGKIGYNKFIDNNNILCFNNIQLDVIQPPIRINLYSKSIVSTNSSFHSNYKNNKLPEMFTKIINTLSDSNQRILKINYPVTIKLDSRLYGFDSLLTEANLEYISSKNYILAKSDRLSDRYFTILDKKNKEILITACIMAHDGSMATTLFSMNDIDITDNYVYIVDSEEEIFYVQISKLKQFINNHYYEKFEFYDFLRSGIFEELNHKLFNGDTLINGSICGPSGLGLRINNIDAVCDNLLLVSLSNGNAYLIDLINKKSKIFEAPSNYEFPAIAKIMTIDNIQYVVYKNEKNTIIYNLDGKIVFKFFINENDYFIQFPPYYMCSKDASKMLHYVTPSLKVIGFEQLDPVYNRPDIVLDSIGKYFGNSDGGMIEEYRKSWEKRIDRLGLDKEKLGKGEIAVPNAEIVGADAIAYDNKNGKLEIKVAANDPKYPLRRFNVYVNEVPLYGSAGISIAHLKKQVWDTTVSVPLSIGENKIQVSVMNELGLENFKYPSYVNYAPSEPIVAKTYYIGIGVNEFKESSHNLKYCVKDVTDLSTSFGGPNTEVKLFTNAQVTKENILALKDYLAKTTVNDKVIISCSSHGLLDDSLNFYLAMHDVDFNNPKARGLKYEELESLLDGIPARQKLLLLDACNSGENDKTELLNIELAQAEKQVETPEIAELKTKIKGGKMQLVKENKSNFKKMNELFVNVRNNTGSVIISAAGGQESALEGEIVKVDGKSIKNGAFTYCVLEYLKMHEGDKEALTVNQLKNYVEKRVEEITNGKQQPTSRQETMEIDWRLR